MPEIIMLFLTDTNANIYMCENMIALLKNKKIKLLSIVFLVTLLTCLFTKYILKLLIPFIIAYLLARFVSLIADKINKKIHF